MSLLRPVIYQKSIYVIDYQRLKQRGIKCLLFDLDNTCVGYHEKNPTKELKQLFNKLIKMGFRVVIFSNAMPKRLIPFNGLGVECHPASKKPFSYSFSKMLRKYDYKEKEVCIIGDQLFTDILGGNRIGIVTCLVEPLSLEDFILTKVFRMMERYSFNRMERKNLIKRGEYYE